MIILILEIFQYSAKIVIASDYAHKYGITDIDGRRVPSHRELRNIAPFLPKKLRFVTNILPGGFKVPQALIDVARSKYI